MNNVSITVSHNDLKDALNIAQSTLSNSSDITSHFLFICNPSTNTVHVCSSELPRTFSMIPLTGANLTFDAEQEDDVRFTVQGKRLVSCNSHVNGVLTITYNYDEKEVTFSDAQGVNYFSSLNPSDFPDWEDKLNEAINDVGENKVLIDSDKLYETILSLKPYVSLDETRRPELCVLAFKDGVGYTCDGFGLGMARDDSFNALGDMMIHYLDFNSLTKYLKAHSGNDVEVLKSSQATFFKMPDGAVYGYMNSPYTYPQQITEKYSDSFDYFPNRTWGFNKNSLASALSFMMAGANEGDTTFIFTDDLNETHLPPRIEMESSASSNMVGRDLNPIKPEIPLTENQELKDFDFSQVYNLGERMLIADLVNRAKGESKEDVPTFKFNSLSLKRILDTVKDNIYFGVQSEEQGRGYMIFKNTTDTGIQVASVYGWVR